MEDPERRLREEVRYLGARLGETLRTSSGLALFDLVEHVRAEAKAGQAGDGDAAQRLVARLGRITAEEAYPLARAFAHFLALANVADSHHRARAYVQQRALSDPLRAALQRLVAAGLDPADVARAASRQSIELVLTAHPTQASRRTVLAKYERIAEALARRAAPKAGSAEPTAAVDEEIAREIASAWHTDDVRRLRPTPLGEARVGLSLFERTLWDAVPAFARAWDGALREVTGRALPVAAAPIRFGNWMGGDRDGNPNVTAAATLRVCLLARRQAAELYGRELARLDDELSIVVATAELAARAGGAREPYRAILRGLASRAEATVRHGDELLGQSDEAILAAPITSFAWLTRAELEEPLVAMHQSLHAVGLGLVADGRLLDVLRRLAAFGVVLAPLDVRQHALVHEAALEALTLALDLGRYAEWSETERQDFLIAELASKRPLVPRRPPDDPALTELLQTLAVCASMPAGSLGAYVISGATAPSDVLAVLLLQRETAVDPPMRVVPLFETLQDLENAPAIVDTLLGMPAFRERLADGLEIMIGYSDSAKDAGRIASAWALYEAQEQLVAVAARHGVPLTLFHGRGGTIGRGGGPIALSIRSQPPGSIGDRLRVTVQGESIDAAFALPAIADQTFGLYVTAALESNLTPARAPSPAWRTRMREVAARSTAVYRGALEDPRFYDYFQAATPEHELSLLQIGSRPAKRAAGGGIGALRAIPWIFAWSQNRLALPAWLGAHAAFEARDEADAALLDELMREWPFFGALVDLLEMVAAKVDLPIASHYEQALVPEALRPFGEGLRASFTRTRAAILALRKRGVLLEGSPVLRWSIDVRNPYVQPLNLLQVELLRRLRAQPHVPPEEHADRRWVDALLVTIHGVAAGMRNTG